MLFPETHLFCINCIKFFDFPCFMLIYMQEMPNPAYSIALFLYRFGKNEYIYQAYYSNSYGNANDCANTKNLPVRSCRIIYGCRIVLKYIQYTKMKKRG